MRKIKKIKNYLLTHKIVSGVLLVILILLAYWLYSYLTNTDGQTRYLVSAVEKGQIITIVSGSGQVSALNQVNLTAKTSGEAVYVGAKSGDYVTTGQLLVQLNTRDAEMALTSARLALSKAKELTISKSTDTGLAKNSSDALAVLSDYFIDAVNIVDGLNNIYNNYNVSTYKNSLGNDTARNLYNTASASNSRAKASYDTELANYRSLGNNLTDAQVQQQISQALTSAQLLARAVKDTNFFVNFVYDQVYYDKTRPSDLTTDKANSVIWTQTLDSNIASLLASRNTVTNSAYDIQSLELTLKQKEYSYQDCFIRAPFDGRVQINVNRGDQVNGSVGTIVTNQKVATVSLNEVDITKIKIGQKATLTFDAIDGLSIIGQVTGSDIVGTVSQGVVTYDVKISFYTQDDRIRSGMSVNADIATAVKQDVLTVPNSAIKTQSDSSYVEVFASSTPVTTGNQGILSDVLPMQQMVQTGLSDDDSTEIISGLQVGDKIVTRVITSATAQSTSQAPSLFGGSTNRNVGSTRSTGR